MLSGRATSTWAAVVPAALTLVLGGAFIGRNQMWYDEAATWFFSSQPISDIARNSAHTDVVYLPYYLFMHFWLGGSHAAWWLRLPSLLAGAATVAALVLLARRWLPLGWSVLAGFLLALNPLFATLTIEARPYTAVALIAVLSTAALVNAIDRGGRRRWVLYGVAILCMLLLHLVAVFVAAAQLAGVLIARRRSALASMVATLGCVAVAISPLVAKAAGQAGQESWIPRSTISTFHAALNDVSGGRIEQLALVICGIIVIAALAAAPAGSDRALWFALCLAWGAVPILLLVLVSFVHPFYVPRYAAGCLPGVALIEALAAWRVWTFLAAKRRTPETSVQEAQGPASAWSVRWHRRQPWAFVPATIATGAASVVVVAYLALNSTQQLQRPHQPDDYRSVAAALSRDLSEQPQPFAIIPNAVGIGVSPYVTSPALAHAIMQQATRANIRLMLDRSSVVDWPIGSKPDAPATRCAAGWAIGVGAVPSKTFIVDGSSCRVSRVHHYGAEWVASLGG